MSNNSEGNKRIAKNTLFLYLRLVLVLLVSLYTSRVVLHTLGIVDYGIYNVVAGFVSMFALLSTALTGATQRFYNYEIGKNGEDGIQKVFVSATYIQLIIAVIIILLTETIGLWYVTNKMVYPPEREQAVFVVYQASVIALLFVVMQVPYTAAIVAHEKINYYALISVLDVLLKLMIAIVVPLLGFDNLSIYGILIAGVSVIDFAFYSLYARRNYPQLRFKREFHTGTFVEMLKFSGWSALNTFSQVVKNQGLNILINLFFGPVVNAARGISYQIKSALLGFVTNITTAAQPQVTESYAIGNVERSKRLMFTISKFIFFSLYIVALPIMLEVGFILRLWLGNDIPEYSEIFTILVLIIALIDILITPITMIISASGKIGRFNLWYSIFSILVLPIAYLVLKIGYSPVSVYIISLLLSMLMEFASVIILKKEIGVSIRFYCQQVLIPIMGVVLSTSIIPLIVVNSLEPGLYRVIITIFLSLVIVAASSYYLGLNKSERVFIQEYAKKFFNKFKG